MENVAIVIPGSRPAIFIRQHLARLFGKPHWSPSYFTINEFNQHCSGFRAIDRPRLLFEAFAQWPGSPSEFEEFLKWAPAALREFNDIDHYLLDAQVVFRNLESFKAIEDWSFESEDLSEGQVEFDQFWRSLLPAYEAIRQHLVSMKRGYPGLIARQALRSIQDQGSGFDMVYFVGFNALTKAEEQIIKRLVTNDSGRVFWDADEYYIDDITQEAGHFLRRYRDSFSGFSWSENQISQNHRIGIHHCPTPISMVSIGAEMLRDLDAEALGKTAVVLADESLLIPFLHSIPDNVQKVNVTMGVPLQSTPAGALVQSVIRCVKTRNNGLLERRALVQLLRHPWILSMLEEDDLPQLMRQGKYALDIDFWNNGVSSGVGNLLQWMWTDTDTNGFIRGLKNTIREVHEKVQSPVNRQALLATYNLLNEMSFLGSNLKLINSDLLEQLWQWIIGNEQLDLKGEPVEGLQVMGVLESRGLDFERVLILGANEGSLPRSADGSGIIPFEIRAAFDMPTRTDQEAIYAYYFYRLLHGAKQVDILYSEQSESFQSSEPSRYILQLRHEFPNPSVLEEKNWTLNIPAMSTKGLPVGGSPLTADLIKRRLEKGLSPSAINTYYRCPLDFYFKYVLGFKEPDTDPNEPSSADVGSVVHEVLELIYTPFIGSFLEHEKLKRALEGIEELAEQKFKAITKIQHISGKNLLAFEVVRKYLTSVINWDMEALKKGGKCKLLSLEEKMHGAIPYHKNDVAEINIVGIADRIDEFNGQVRVIDYKSGAVIPSDLILNHADKAFKVGKEKSLQLLAYEHLSREKYGPVETGILSFRSISRGLMKLSVKQSVDSGFADNVMKFADQLYSEESSWNHNENSQFCHFCK